MKAIDWHEMTPSEVLDAYPTLNLTQAAYVLNLLKRDGAPDRSQAVALVRAGRLQLVDPDQSNTRWTISRAVLQSYIDGTPLAVAS